MRSLFRRWAESHSVGTAPPLDDALLRVSANATALYACLENLVALDPADPAVAQALDEADACRASVQPTLVELAEELATAGEIPPDDAGEVQQVIIDLREADRRWPDANRDAGALPQAADAVSALLVAIAVLAAQMTVDRRLSVELLRLKPGQSVEIPEVLTGIVPPEGHEQIAQWLAARGNLLANGAVDQRKGVVYRLPVSIGGRAWRFPGAQLLALLASVGVLAVAALIAREAKDPSLSGFGRWLVAYGAVLLGVALHFAIARIKRERPAESDGGPYVPTDVPVVSTWWQWLMLRPFAVGAMLVSPIVTVITLRLLGFPVHLSAPKELATYVFAGYGADSIAGAAFKQLDDLSGAVTGKVIGRLG